MRHSAAGVARDIMAPSQRKNGNLKFTAAGDQSDVGISSTTIDDKLLPRSSVIPKAVIRAELLRSRALLAKRVLFLILGVAAVAIAKLYLHTTPIEVHEAAAPQERIACRGLG